MLKKKKNYTKLPKKINNILTIYKAANVITRSLLGALGIGGTTSSKKKSSWF